MIIQWNNEEIEVAGTCLTLRGKSYELQEKVTITGAFTQINVICGLLIVATATHWGGADWVARNDKDGVCYLHHNRYIAIANALTERH